MSESVWLNLGAQILQWQQHMGHIAAALPPSSLAVETAATVVPETQVAIPGGLAGCCSGWRVDGEAAAAAAAQVSAPDDEVAGC